MTTEFNWVRNYDKEPALEIPVQNFRPERRAEEHENPQAVFVDIYKLVGHLVKPGNLEIRGRRGVGKTMYFINAHSKLAKNYKAKESSILTAYVDLYALDNYLHLSGSPIFRAEQIYRSIIRSILIGDGYVSDSSEERNKTRFCLTSFISTLGWFRRRSTLSVIKELLEYLSGAGEKLAIDREFKSVSENASKLKLDGGAGIMFSPEPRPSIRSGFEATEEFARGEVVTTTGLYSINPTTVRNKLLRIIDAFKADYLVVFIDEFSSPTLPKSVHAILVDRLIKTFSGDRMSIKIATIPGASTLRVNHPVLGLVGVYSDKGLTEFNFDSQMQKYPDQIRTGNFEIFLKNLAYKNRVYSKYIAAEQPETGFSKFVEDQFLSVPDFLEFLNSGEGLPRQLSDTFFEARQVLLGLATSVPQNQLSRLHIWLAAFRDYQKKYRADIQKSKDRVDIMSRVNHADSRVFKLEKISKYDEAVDCLVDLGFIHACSVPPNYEKKISANPLEYYYTSYQAEVAFQIMRIFHSGKKDIPPEFEILDMAYTSKDKFSALYPMAKPVLLSDLVESKGKK